jgi:hypothetical protein
LNINHSAEYIALWKSHKRAQWEAEKLVREAAAMGQQWAMTSGQSPLSSKFAPATVASDALVVARQLQQQSQRMWELGSQIAAELEKVATTLTPRQRKTAEKMLKQWEQEERERNQGDQ